MIEREMVRVQDHDQDQLDTKPSPTCNSKSNTKQCPTADYSPNTGYDEIALIVTLAKRLCTFALCSSDVLSSTGPRPSGPTWKRLAATWQAMLPHLAGRIGRLKRAEGRGPGPFSSTVLNDVTHVE